MLEIENVDVYGWKAAIRGMRNPMNSWARSDSMFCPLSEPDIGEDDLDLMKRLAAGGSTHAKYRRMITVTLDINAPLYWWKEFDTYKVGTVANSCSTMHKIHSKRFGLSDFSIDQLHCDIPDCFYDTLDYLNDSREKYLETKDKKYWWRMIQILPTSYNQRRTILLNYEVLTAIYWDRRNHKLDEWHTFCDWIAALPYSEIITGGK